MFEIRMGDTIVYTHTESSAPYCGFGGSASCYSLPISGSSWPGGSPMTSGVYTLWARSKDSGGHYSPWDSVSFTVYLGPATPTRSPTSTSTPTPSPTPTDAPTATPTMGVLTTDPPQITQSP